MKSSFNLKNQLLSKLHPALLASKIELSKEVQEKLVDYLVLLNDWNQIHNLSGIKDPVEMIPRHLLDSLSVLPHLNGRRIIDVGTGAGLPGIPLALARPDLQFILLDSNRKKMNFVQHVILSLKIPNAEAVCQRVEQYRKEEGFDYVVSRAFASLADFITSSSHLIAPKGQFIAMKGKIFELDTNLPSGYTIAEIVPVIIPDLQAERCLVVVSQASGPG